MSSPAQNPNEITSLEYASCVTAVRLDRRRVAPGEAGDGEIETVPEQVDRARLAIEPAAELLQHPVGPVQHLREALDVLAIPGGVLVIGRERRRHRHAERHLPDLDVDAEPEEDGVQAPVELRDVEPIVQREALDATVGGADHDGVVDEVEGDVERRAAVCSRRVVSPRTST